MTQGRTAKKWDEHGRACLSQVGNISMREAMASASSCFHPWPAIGTMLSMNKLAPFLWFNENAEEAARFYLSVFPHARKLDELRSKGVGPWPVGKIATITIELEGQEMVFLNGGPAHQLNPAFSFFVRCDSQEEIDGYWGKLIEGGKPMACGWLTDRYGVCWQIVPRNIGELISHPKAMQAMMGMIKMDLGALEAAAREA
jgi:predicted 3-demethylubiquinone-9 3-methyltransferase (glyoxalase superfamily)